MGIVEQVNACLRTGHYARALGLLQASASSFPDDVEFSELEKRAQEGIRRNAEAQRLITESQELFAQQKSPEAIRLLQQAYELDKKNSMASAILANSLVEHAQSLVENDWLEAERLTNQALVVNPAHPTAKTVLKSIVERKEKSAVEDWVAKADRLQSAGDVFGALAWVAEGLAIHPDAPKLLQMQDTIQRDQAARRRQTRRRDLEEMRRMEGEIKGAADAAARQALAARIQAVVARYWTDGEVLSIANALLLRLGLLGATASSHKGAPVIFHVPRANAEEPASGERTLVSATQSETLKIKETAAIEVIERAQIEIQPSAVFPQELARCAAPEAEKPQITIDPEAPRTSAVAVAPVRESSTLAAEVPLASSVPAPSPGPKPKALIVGIAAALVILVASFFYARNHYASRVAKTDARSSAISAPRASISPEAAPVLSVPAPAPSETPAEATAPSLSDADAGKAPIADRAIANASPTDTSHGGRSNVVQDPSEQTLRPVKNGQKKSIADQPSESRAHSQPQVPAQPQPPTKVQMASLTIAGGVAGATVLVDQTAMGNIQADGSFSVSNISPGDHTVELRKDRFKARQLKEHFVAGATIALAAVDAALEAAPAILQIDFTPTDARVALVKGDFLAMVRSGTPLNLSPGSYTLTAQTADGFRSSATLELTAGQFRTVGLSLVPSGMANWDNPAAWKQDKDVFLRKGGNFVLYAVVPVSGTFDFSAMPAKGRMLQWVVNYADARNYLLFQIDDDGFHRMVVRNGEKSDEIIVPDKGEKKNLRTLRIHVSPAEVVHQVKHGNNWRILDRWTQPGADLSLGKFGFYIPGNDEVGLSGFAYHRDLNLR